MEAREGPSWNDAGTLVWFDDPEEGHRTYASIEPWWHNGHLVPTDAWVARYFDRSSAAEGWKLTNVLVDAPASPALDPDARVTVEAASLAAVQAGPQPPPPAVRFGAAANTPAGFDSLIDHVGEGLMRAEGRVFRATETKTDDDNLRIAVYETMAWLRTLDEVFQRAWQRAPRNRREDVSLSVDRAITRLQGSGSSLTIFDEAHRGRKASGEPYDDWAIALFRGNVTRNELLGFRWLAGKLLHHGPRQCTELVQWACGEAPRWKWIAGRHVVPEAATEAAKLRNQREAYERTVAGRDVSGMMGFNEVVLEGGRFFRKLHAPTWTPPPAQR